MLHKTAQSVFLWQTERCLRTDSERRCQLHCFVHVPRDDWNTFSQIPDKSLFFLSPGPQSLAGEWNKDVCRGEGNVFRVRWNLALSSGTACNVGRRKHNSDVHSVHAPCGLVVWDRCRKVRLFPCSYLPRCIPLKMTSLSKPWRGLRPALLLQARSWNLLVGTQPQKSEVGTQEQVWGSQSSRPSQTQPPSSQLRFKDEGLPDS